MNEKLSLSLRLAVYLAQKPFNDSDLRAASLFVLDALGNALAGRNSEPGRILLRWAQEQGNRNTSSRAFLQGALTHILETDDLHRSSVTHPGCVVVPPAFEVAKAHGVKGRDFLLAVLRGFEAVCRLGMVVGPAHYRIWHNTATCGPFGAAAAIASLLRLDEEKTMHALGNAGTQSSGLWEFLDTGAMSKHLHAGHAAQAGVVAAELAALGFTGPPKILEGPRGFFAAMCPDGRPEQLLDDAAAPWQVHLASLKPWPSCRHTHPAIDAAQELRRQINGKTEEIESVSVQTYQATLNLCDRPLPNSEYEAKFSLQHCVAAALAMEEVWFEAFSLDSRKKLAPLRARVRVEVAERFEKAYPLIWGTRVDITSRDGRRIAAERAGAKGDPELPLTQAEIVAKAERLLNHGRVSEPKRLIEAILALPQDGPLPDVDFQVPS
jgi:2-methylcitrate dehydratase PrpD